MTGRFLRAGSRLAAISAISLFCLARSAQAQVLVYSDTSTFSGFGFANGSAATVSGDGITEMVADDIHFPSIFSPQYKINSFTFSVANFNSSAVSARPEVRFYNDNGTSGGPGSFITGFNFNPISFSAGTVQLFTFSQSNMFAIPADDVIWAGITFDNNNGATGATLAQLNNLGQGLFNPPTLGSSQDVFFKTSTAGSFVVNNPAGGFFFFGGNPVANFGWAFSAGPTPEPSSFVLLSAFMLGGIGFARLRRRA